MLCLSIASRRANMYRYWKIWPRKAWYRDDGCTIRFLYAQMMLSFATDSQKSSNNNSTANISTAAAPPPISIAESKKTEKNYFCFAFKLFIEKKKKKIALCLCTYMKSYGFVGNFSTQLLSILTFIKPCAMICNLGLRVCVFGARFISQSLRRQCAYMSLFKIRFYSIYFGMFFCFLSFWAQLRVFGCVYDSVYWLNAVDDHFVYLFSLVFSFN